MNTSKIEAALASSPKTQHTLPKFKANLAIFEQAKADQKIYNVDFENAKYWVHQGCEYALEVAAEAWRERYRQSTQSYQNNDPRWNIGYMVSPLHAQGFYNKLKKYENDPAVKAYMEVLEEVAQIGALEKEIKPFIVKGRKPSGKPPVELDLSNTGICPVCFKRQKLTFDSKMVDHGYTVPHGWGGRNGHCLGFKHAPYELSNEGVIYYKGILEGQQKRNADYIARLKAGEIPEFERRFKTYKGPGKWEPVVEVIKKGEPRYDEIVSAEIAKTEQEQKFLESDIVKADKLIKDWTLQPLKYGGPETQERWKHRLQQK